MNGWLRQNNGMRVILIGIFIVSLGLRLLGLGTFMTADEPNWMVRSAEFYHHLFRDHNPGGTFLTSHPGVVTMWLSGAGIVLQEHRLGFDIDQSNLAYFRIAATVPIALATSVLIIFIAWLLVRLVGPVPGLWAGFLLAVDPYVTGMSQIAHVDAVLGLCMVAALLLFLLFKRTGVLAYILWCGVFTGLALLNKFLPALWLFPSLCMIDTLWRSDSLSARLRPVAVHMATISGVASLVVFALWPAVWSMHNVNEYFERDAVSIATTAHTDLEASSDPISPASFYPRMIASRLSPFAAILSIAFVVATLLIIRRRPAISLAFIWYAAGFIVFISLAAKKADRYALPAFIFLPIMAGLAMGWGTLALRRLQWWSSVVGKQIAAGFVVVLLIAQAILVAPYAIAYHNPLFDIRPLHQQGWGEGLDQAAAWLNANPLMPNLTIASWYPSVMATYFKGKTMSLSARHDDRVAYIVTYRNMAARDSDDIATSVLEELRGRQPLKTFYIQGEPYVSVYESIGLPYFEKNIGELLPGMEAGQTITAPADNLQHIEIGFSTFNSRHNTSDVVLHVKESPDAEKDIRTVTVNAADILDSDWHVFNFDPISDSKGKTYYISITSPNASSGNAATVRFSEKDIRPGQMLLRRRALKDGEKNSDFLRSGDIAYRL
jgi:hypothetical protein